VRRDKKLCGRVQYGDRARINLRAASLAVVGAEGIVTIPALFSFPEYHVLYFMYMKVKVGGYFSAVFFSAVSTPDVQLMKLRTGFIFTIL